MAKSLNYYDFAENDYYFCKRNIEIESFSTGLAALLQNTVERYLKHIIDTYVPIDDNNENQRTKILHTHTIRAILAFLKEELPSFQCDCIKIGSIDGYYYTSRYPGDGCFLAKKDDLIHCWNVLQYTKQVVDEYISQNNKSQQINERET